LTHSLALFPPFDTSGDGLDSAADGFLNEVRGKFGFLTELVVQSVSCSRVGRDTLSVGVGGPTEFSSTVGTMKELPGGFVEVIAALVGSDEFDRCGTPDLHISN
jgi:hypothetical protein